MAKTHDILVTPSPLNNGNKGKGMSSQQPIFKPIMRNQTVKESRVIKIENGTRYSLKIHSHEHNKETSPHEDRT